MRRLLLFLFLAATFVLAGESIRPSAFFDSAQLLEDLRNLSSAEMQGRAVDTPGGARAREYVVKRFRESGILTFGHSYNHPFRFTTRRDRIARQGVNILGYIDGKDHPKRFIIVSAHYDHIGAQNGQVFYGADDNASGTAALFAIAAYFSAHQPSNSILFAAFDAEESGLYGSQAFLRQSPIDRSRMAIDLNIDMIGRDPEDRLFVVGTHLQTFLKPYIDRLTSRTPVQLLIGHDDPSNKNVDDWTRDSDHYTFIRAGIPALYFGVEDYQHHHQVTDTFETITTDFYIRATETLVQVVREFDSNLDTIANR